MPIKISKEALFWTIDELLARYRSTPRGYPFNRPDAIIPQTLIPAELRKDKETLAIMYVAINEHMKGRTQSIDAFRAHVRIWKKYPWFYHPRRMLWEKPARIMEVLQEFVPIDHRNVTRDLRINYMHLETYYGGSAINLMKGVDSYAEALRRIRNKRTKRERDEAGYAGEGLYGHQHKMVSMLVHFFDWEGWLRPRFVYPPPGDIQNFRVALASGALVPFDLEGATIRNYELIAAPWRQITEEYIRVRKEDPKPVAEVLWLFGNLMCGNSPLTRSQKRPKPGDKYEKKESGQSALSMNESKVSESEERVFLHQKFRKGLAETCFSCPLLKRCNYAIPSEPYYAKGLLVLRPRPKMEELIDTSLVREPVFSSQTIDRAQIELLG